MEEDDIVKLNVGGHKYYTTRSTLLSHHASKCSDGDPNKNGRSFFDALLSGQFKARKDDEGFIFIDRNGKYFEPILDYLRTGEWMCPAHLAERVLLKEARFYGIEPSTYSTITDFSLKELQHNTLQQQQLKVINAHLKSVEKILSVIAQSFYDSISKNPTGPCRSPVIFPAVPTLKQRLETDGFSQGVLTDFERRFVTQIQAVIATGSSEVSEYVFDDDLCTLTSEHHEVLQKYFKHDRKLSVEVMRWFMHTDGHCVLISQELHNTWISSGFQFVWAQQNGNMT